VTERQSQFPRSGARAGYNLTYDRFRRRVLGKKKLKESRRIARRNDAVLYRRQKEIPVKKLKGAQAKREASLPFKRDGHSQIGGERLDSGGGEGMVSEVSSRIV